MGRPHFDPNNLQGILSNRKLLFLCFLLDGIRKYGRFLWNENKINSKFPIRRNYEKNCPIIFVKKVKTFFCSCLFFGGKKDTTFLLKTPYFYTNNNFSYHFPGKRNFLLDEIIKIILPALDPSPHKIKFIIKKMTKHVPVIKNDVINVFAKIEN